jgi:3-hydroxyisobutyrate dehydrogenase-like beta-hydroxyacid dehydrogenase
MKVGFIGLGHMGQEIAKHLLIQNRQLMVWNRTPAKAAALTDAGAILAESLKDAMANDVLFSMLTDDPAIEETLNGSGVFEQARKGIIHVNLSTISPLLASKLASFHRKREQRYISAPVLGRPEVAQAGKLTVVAAGDLEVLPNIQPLFDSFGQKTWPLGTRAEKANVVKLAANLMLAAAIESMSEASAFVSGYGVAPGQLLEITNSNVFACPAYQIYGRGIADETFEPAEFTVHLGAKDVRLGLAAAEEVNVPMPLSSVVRDSLLEAKAMGKDSMDLAVLGRVARIRAGQR